MKSRKFLIITLFSLAGYKLMKALGVDDLVSMLKNIFYLITYDKIS